MEGGSGHRLLKQAVEHKRLAVVGNPGSGKTTFLRWIAWVVTGDRLGETTEAAKDRLGLAECLAGRLPLLRARLVPGPEGTSLSGRRVLGFAGIGRPQKFFDSLAAAGAELVARRSFADHHPYRPDEIAALKAEAARLKASLVTTEKDLVRLGAAAAEGIAALPVALVWEDPGALDAILDGLKNRLEAGQEVQARAIVERIAEAPEAEGQRAVELLRKRRKDWAGELLAALGRPGEAAQCFAEEGLPYRAGRLFAQSGKRREAGREYEAALRLGAHGFEKMTLHAELGKLLMELGEFAPAAAHFQQGLAVGGDDPKVSGLFGHQHAAVGQPGHGPRLVQSLGHGDDAKRILIRLDGLGFRDRRRGGEQKCGGKRR